MYAILDLPWIKGVVTGRVCVGI